MARPFADRRAAGRELAAKLIELRAAHPAMLAPVLLALPRGGVPVSLEIARALGAPLDLVMVRKVGVPFQPELAAAAVADGDAPLVVVNRDVVRLAGLDDATLQAAERRELAEIARRRALYLQGRAAVEVEGRDAIVVDDGVATGATTRVALRSVRLRRPRSLTLAVPVGPREVLDAIAPEVDHLVCLRRPEDFWAIGAFYADFRQVDDAEVVAMLDEARRFDPASRT